MAGKGAELGGRGQAGSRAHVPRGVRGLACRASGFDETLFWVHFTRMRLLYPFSCSEALAELHVYASLLVLPCADSFLKAHAKNGKKSAISFFNPLYR